MNAPRRHFGKDQKVAILKRYLVDKGRNEKWGRVSFPASAAATVPSNET